jgi:hypothetical protein
VNRSGKITFRLRSECSSAKTLKRDQLRRLLFVTLAPHFQRRIGAVSFVLILLKKVLLLLNPSGNGGHGNHGQIHRWILGRNWNGAAKRCAT